LTAQWIDRCLRQLQRRPRHDPVLR
jgi:hypothetical protein